MEKKRYVLLDSIRGLALINMILYHALWDLVYLYHVSLSWFKSEGAYMWQQVVCWTFFFLSGFCWHFGRCKWKRGLWLLAVSTVISIVTVWLMPENRILFGVLSALGTCMLLLIPLHKGLQKINPYIGILGSFLLFILTRNVNDGTLSFGKWELLTLPESWYANLVTAYVGFPAEDFISTDYFSVIPWVFLYLVGYYFYYVFEKKEWFGYLTYPRIPVLEWFGRYSIWIYICHQPVIYGVLQVLFSF